MVLGLLLLGRLSASADDPFNNPPGVDIWCGKAYRPEDAAFDPGGWLNAPEPSRFLLLDLRVFPRMSVYTADDSEGSFILEARTSRTRGIPYCSGNIQRHDVFSVDPVELAFEVSDAETGRTLVTGLEAPALSISHEVSISIGDLMPRFAPYTINVKLILPDCDQIYTTSTKIFRLPRRDDGGGVTKIDQLYGGLMVQDYLSNSTEWKPLFPFSYYVSWGGWLEQDLTQVDAFKAAGYNIIHVVPGGGYPPVNWTTFEQFFDLCDELGLWVMYDLRHTYQNRTLLSDQISRFASRKSLLLWYTADEPDGHCDPLEAPKTALGRIRELDPWHPVSLCLNCANFHYEEYSAGADIILSDVYPVAVNTSYSEVYGTVCNTTYGCCGCDNCEGRLSDVSDRLDAFRRYQDWLGTAPPKSFWGVPQAFGDEMFWRRNPTPEEEVAMVALSVNHDAKGIVGWIYPTTDSIAAATRALARVVTSEEITAFLLGSSTQSLEVHSPPAAVDAAAWVRESKMLVSVVNSGRATQARVSIILPEMVVGIAASKWGDGSGWKAAGRELSRNGLGKYEVDIVVLDLA
ncbi:hypothetical protein BDY21DRAFT_287945 [Lineolata rhizophorae]|uniref:Glycoside hydrolase superfamily n=1 Tax=Lineolata rhizophorae TaxID=578093 RepID=A0A6A6NY89_9PEZI|nr:hypothetical protein BDY21DRAFT_287945 [Lineolata rhizophorae]